MGGGLGLGWDGLFLHVVATGASMGDMLGARCGLSCGREDCGRGVGICWDGPYVHVEAAGASKGGPAGCTLWALSGPRGLWDGVGMGLGWPVCARRGCGCN